MHTFATTTPITAVLDIPAGRIQLIAADRTDTTVEVRPAKTGKGRDAKAADQIEVTYDEGTLRVAAPAAKNQFFGPSGSVEVTIQLPAGSRVEGKAGGAELRGVGRLGDVAFDGAYGTPGAVKIDEAASVRLSAHSGDVTVGRLTGPAEISVQQGDIAVTEAAAAVGKVVLRTRMGNVSIGAAPGVSASLDAGTGYGRIDNALRNTGDTTGLTIHATTDHGDITARSL